MQIPDHIRRDHLPETSQCPGIRNLLRADAGKLSVHQIGPYLTLQHLVAPIANMLQDQQAKHDLSKSLAAAN